MCIRDSGGHAHGDARGTVYQQVGEPAGQHVGLHQGFVEIGIEIYGLIVKIPHHFHGKLAEPGIAVGMATNIPPHNLGEVVDAVVCMLDNPECTVDDLMQYIKLSLIHI